MVVIFDLDGTLLDTYQIIRKSFIEVFDNFLPNHRYTEEELQSYFGPPIYETFMKLVHDEELTLKLINEYRKFSFENHKYLKTFPNTSEALKVLKDKGYKIAVLSNKAHSGVKRGLEATNIDHFIDYIVGNDDVVNPKPSPEGIYKIMNYFGSDSYIFVGDSYGDIKASLNANIDSIGVTWALSKKEDFIEWKATYIANDIWEVIKILEEKNV